MADTGVLLMKILSPTLMNWKVRGEAEELLGDYTRLTLALVGRLTKFCWNVVIIRSLGFCILLMFELIINNTFLMLRFTVKIL